MKKLLLLFLFTSAVKFASGQKQGQELIDSLTAELSKAKEDTNKVHALNSLGRTYLNISESEKAIDYIKQALTLSEKLNFKKGQGNAYSIIGMIYDSRGDNDKALKNYKMSLKICEQAGDKKGMASSLNNIGIVCVNQNNYPDALKMYFAAVKINEETGNKAWLANNYNNIGILYQYQGNYSGALKMAFAALKIYETSGDSGAIANSYNNIGLLYWAQKEYTEALAIYSKALKVMEEVRDTESMNHPYNNMAGIYADMGNYTEALKNDSLSLKIREKMGDKNLIADSYTGIGIVFQRTNRFPEAIINFNKALKLYTETANEYAIAGINASFGEIDLSLKKFNEARNFFSKAMDIYKRVGDPTGYYYIYEDLAKTDSAAGNYKSALDNYKMFVIYRDSAANQENTKKLIQTQMQYDFDKKEALTKAEQEKKDAIAQKELQKQKLVRNGFVGGFVIVLLFAGVFFSQRNKIKKGKKRSDELLLNILPEEVAEELKAKGSADAKQFDDVTVMFTDFKNFTQISEKLSPAELVAEIHTCFKAFDNIISKHNIEKIKTIGDSYMCAGGLPVANKTNATDVVKAAMEIQQFMQQHLQQRRNENKEPFEIRIGIHTGPVVAGIVGVKKFAYDIWGDTVNIASRMESSGEAGKVNISGSTYELVKDKFNCFHRGKIQAKNKGEIDMYFVGQH